MAQQDDISTKLDEIADSVRYSAVIMEQTLSEVQLLKEAVSDVQRQAMHIPTMREDIGELSSDAKLIKAVVTETNQDIHGLEQRMARLEAGA